MCSPLACLLSFTIDYSGFAASIPGDRLASFPSPKETYSGQRVRVRGTIVDRNGRPRIEVGDPGDLQVLGGAGAASASAPRASRPRRAGRGRLRRAGRLRGAAGERFVLRRSRGSSTRAASLRGSAAPGPPAPPPSGDSVVAALSGGPGDAATVEARALQQQIDKLTAANAELTAAVAELQERLTVLEQAGGVRAAASTRRTCHSVRSTSCPARARCASST